MPIDDAAQRGEGTVVLAAGRHEARALRLASRVDLVLEAGALLVAADGVNFCLSEAKLGLLPATIGPYVVKAMGEQAARRWFVTAERFSAAQAQAMGFVHEAVPAEALDRLSSRTRIAPPRLALATRMVIDTGSVCSSQLGWWTEMGEISTLRLVSQVPVSTTK